MSPFLTWHHQDAQCSWGVDILEVRMWATKEKTWMKHPLTSNSCDENTNLCLVNTQIRNKHSHGWRLHKTMHAHVSLLVSALQSQTVEWMMFDHYVSLFLSINEELNEWHSSENVISVRKKSSHHGICHLSELPVVLTVSAYKDQTV